MPEERRKQRMKQFKTIFKYELRNYVSNKAFIVVTLLIVIAIGVYMFFPRLSDAFSSDDNKGGDTAATQEVILLLEESGVDKEAIESAFADEFENYKLEQADSVDTIKTKIKEKKAECGFVFHSYSSYTYIVNNIGVGDSRMDEAERALKVASYKALLSEHGANKEEIEKSIPKDFERDPQPLTSDQTQNFFYTYIMIFALYFVIIMYGQMIANGVASEKSSRAMEVLITSAKPKAMMFGKVFAGCTAGIGQLVIVFGSAILFYKLNESYHADNMITKALFNIPGDLMIYMLVFSLLGFLVYAFMYGAVGSMASKMEDISTLVTPITILYVIVFMVVITNMTGENVSNPVMVVASYVPFSSPMAMFTRVAMGNIAWYEIALSIGILVVTVILIAFVAARIYRQGVLHYGKPPKFGDMLKSAK